MNQLEFETALRRGGFDVVNTSQRPNARTPDHCHDFDVRFLVLGGEITVTRNNTIETLRTGQSCEISAGYMHAESVGPEGVAYLFGCRRPGSAFAHEVVGDTQSELHKAIRERAYFIWKAEGCPTGCAEEHWQRALKDEEVN